MLEQYAVLDGRMARLTATVMMDPEHEHRFSLLMQLIDEQAPALLAVDGALYEGHIESCLAGVVRVVARPFGSDQVRRQYVWRLEEITDFGPRELHEQPAEAEDPLMTQARELTARAQEYDGMSLAERLLAERTRPKGA